MKDSRKTKQQLIEELTEARAHIVHLQARVDEAEQEQARYRAIANSEVAGVTVTDPEENLLFANPAFAKMVKYSQEELANMNLDQMTSPDEYTRFQEHTSRREQGIHSHYETMLQRKDGSALNVLVAASPVIDGNGTFQGTLALVTDITDRRRAEEALWESEKRFRSIAETAGDAIIIFDCQENIFFWNQAAQDIFGYWAGETRGKLLASILSSTHLEKIQAEIEQVVAEGSSDFLGSAVEVTGVRKDGTEFPLEISFASWKTKEDVFFTAIARDITARKQAEDNLERAYAEVEQLVQKRTAELENEIVERERLQQEVIEAHQRSLRELSTPIIPVMDRIIVMPLVGSIDSMRARDITRSLLAGIRAQRAKVVILDITGVPIVDSGVASHLNKTIQAARLKGARTIITGVSDAVAETIVDLGIDWAGFETLSDLQTGLRAALDQTGLQIVKKRNGGPPAAPNGL